MVGLTKTQKETLEQLKKELPEYIEGINRYIIVEDVSQKLGIDPADAHKAIDYLIREDFVDKDSSGNIRITDKGIEKLEETFITRTKDEIHNNPLAVIAIIISVLSIMANIYTSVHTSQRTESLSIDLNEVKGKLAEYDTLVVRNFTSTSNTISFLCSNGTVPSEEKVNESGVYFLCAPK